MCVNQTLILSSLSKHHFSANITCNSSPGLVRMNDPLYTNLPAERREPPAPIDPSSKPTRNIPLMT